MLWRSNGGLQTFNSNRASLHPHHPIRLIQHRPHLRLQMSFDSRLTTPASKPQRSVKSKASTGKLKKRKDASAPLFRRTWWRKDRLTFYHIKDVPRYLQDNPYIHTGYRSGYSYRENWISFFHLHNESVRPLSHIPPLANMKTLFIVQCLDPHTRRSFLYCPCLCGNIPMSIHIPETR
ncbi:hypothetical protein BC829DRAFT_68297 [Chytridium lagenaria]|nr:hypothetical protein BC829DRAFT_68297 [Chytridium lagenaria]